MIPYDDTNVVPWFNALSPTAINAWADACETNWMNAWTSQFSLSTDQINSLSQVPPLIQGSFINGLRQYAIEKTAGRSVDTSGLSISGGGRWIIHLNVVYTGGLFPIVSIWWEHRP